jgi:hypothetical protein
MMKPVSYFDSNFTMCFIAGIGRLPVMKTSRIRGGKNL